MKTKPPKVKATGNGGESQKTLDDSQLVPFVCPDCSGPIFCQREGKVLQFRCVVGHRFSPDSFTEAHRDALERALWIAIRTLENRAQIHRFLADRAVEAGDVDEAKTITEAAVAAKRDIELVKQIMDRL